MELFKIYLQERIQYLKDAEWKAIGELEGLIVGSIERIGKWELIKELANRRHELEDALLFLNKQTNPEPSLTPGQ